MTKYIIQRFISMIVTILAIATFTFILMHIIPGGPYTSEKALPDAVVQAINEKYHLDDPLYKQYFDYMSGVLTGDFGPSYQFKDKQVSSLIIQGFSYTARIGVLSILTTLIIGIPLGIFAALKQNGKLDFAIMFGVTLGVSIPSFVIASILIYFFAIKIDIFPAISSTLDNWKAYVLPVIALTAFSLSYIVRLMRSSMLDVISSDYIRTARAKGISEFRVVMKHAMKNAIIPIVTYVGPMVAGLLVGSFVIEKMFAIPGLGQYFVNSITNRDYTMIMGTTIFYAIILVIMNFLVDIAYGFIDPRVKLSNKALS